MLRSLCCPACMLYPSHASFHAVSHAWQNRSMTKNRQPSDFFPPFAQLEGRSDPLEERRERERLGGLRKVAHVSISFPCELVRLFGLLHCCSLVPCLLKLCLALTEFNPILCLDVRSSNSQRTSTGDFQFMPARERGWRGSGSVR